MLFTRWKLSSFFVGTNWYQHKNIVKILIKFPSKRSVENRYQQFVADKKKRHNMCVWGGGRGRDDNRSSNTTRPPSLVTALIETKKRSSAAEGASSRQRQIPISPKPLPGACSPPTSKQVLQKLRRVGLKYLPFLCRAEFTQSARCTMTICPVCLPCSNNALGFPGSAAP